MDVDRLAECPLTNGILGRRNGFILSRPKEERRLPDPSKAPERFSLRAACNPKPESLRETGVDGKLEETGDGTVGDGGECRDPLLCLLVVAVDGRADGLVTLVSIRCWLKALKTGTRDEELTGPSNSVELMPTCVAKVDGSGLDMKTCGFSEENASLGKVSFA